MTSLMHTGNVPAAETSEWDMETDTETVSKLEEIGTATLPILESLAERLPTLEGAMLCTADGYNLCALGLESYQVGRLAAMTSTMFSVSNGAIDAITSDDKEASPLEQVTLKSGDSQYMIYPIQHDQLGYLLMSMWAQEITLGEFLMEAKISARELTRLVQIEDL
ncbi:roadblock/LC7 domain-containing protein [Dermatophilus congolensis]|uniref:Roadblock/LC7 domain n=1 Tax=Dermatophilus congolensis TaxID=1863 RepID=A0A239VJP8_9MICO|nr:hypothetical protein [Dermatophilus congolensis]MBO3129160.1 hypothetical protein [Dermatophilus congolensis]MBO3132204.1 hypothetical protein [Dermatophilus congolensis]MBO3133637.1 hypothetical protein [Dermatophilus congolensis]MBO3135870.1 hypothetical protein [Dermatophilus congolensis]MBO3138110.1 hypothetical protein [Dermatophilus congolensis]